MATTVVPSTATAEAFERSFDRAVLQSERLRVTVVIVGLVAIIGRWLVLAIFFPEVVQGQHLTEGLGDVPGPDGEVVSRGGHGGSQPTAARWKPQAG